MKKKKIKEIKLPMKFNPGLQKYEPVLALRKTGRKVKVKMNIKDIIIGITILVLITIFIIFLKNNYT